jgi:hypothetical protein
LGLRVEGAFLFWWDMTSAVMPLLPTARDDVLLRRVGSEWILFDARRDRAHVLNLTAAVVWTYCDGAHGCTAMAEAIAREMQDARAEAISSDIQAVLRRFADEGLLR